MILLEENAGEHYCLLPVALVCGSSLSYLAARNSLRQLDSQPEGIKDGFHGA
jgi:hypothetical protein